MTFMKRFILATFVCLAAAGCGTQMKVAAIDPATGLLKSERGEIGKAAVLVAKTVSLAPFREMAFVSNGGAYGIEQLRAIKFFDQVVGYEDLQRIVVLNKLQDKVPSLSEPIGLSKLYQVYKPFLWVNFKVVPREGKPYLQLVATNPETFEDLFVSEVHLDFAWAGVNDQNARYPLFNALIEWMNQNRGPVPGQRSI